MLGTTKPPYSLVADGRAAARARDTGSPGGPDGRAALDRIADRRVAERWRRAGPDRLPVDHADAARGRRRDGEAQGRVRRASGLLRSARVRGPGRIDGMRAAGRRHDRRRARGCRARAGGAGHVHARRRPEPDLAARRRRRRASAHGSFSGFLDTPYPAWDLLDLRRYRLPLVDSPYVIVETSRGCPYSCDFCVAPIHQGHKFRERSPRRSWTKSSAASASSA